MGKTISTDITSFTDLIGSDAPQCPDLLKKKEVRKAAREFFRETRAWRERSENYTLCRGDKEIVVNRLTRKFAVDCTVLEVNDMWLSDDQTPLSKFSFEAMDKNVPTWRTDTADQPTGYSLTPQGIIRMYPAMADDAENIDVDIELILIPTLSMETFPDFMFNLYGEIIAAGAIKSLLMQPGQPWSDSIRAGYFSNIYKSGLQHARYEEAKRVVDSINDANRELFI